MADSSLPRRRTGLPDLMEWFGSSLPDIPAGWVRKGSHLIPIEVSDDGSRFVLRAELPGVDPDNDIEITVEGDTLTVRAEHTETTEDKDKRHSEFRYGSFERTVRLPFAVPQEETTADYQDGILTVTVPRPTTPEPASRTVPVRRTG
ncbi:Hsp20/alpha crystallin family protein [Streptomyces sp. NPDC047315]|uniref:Hsp20/alpha crystallin family protein n=1 Tax=Streptomyces sp. NPDC047315 TaxID=3155142 RepID=UPI0033FB5DAD